MAIDGEWITNHRLKNLIGSHPYAAYVNLNQMWEWTTMSKLGSPKNASVLPYNPIAKQISPICHIWCSQINAFVACILSSRTDRRQANYNRRFVSPWCIDYIEYEVWLPLCSSHTDFFILSFCLRTKCEDGHPLTLCTS